MAIQSTADFQNAEDAAEALGDIASELNYAEGAVEEGDFEDAQQIVRQLVDELNSVLGWLNEQIGSPAEGTGTGTLNGTTK